MIFAFALDISPALQRTVVKDIISLHVDSRIVDEGAAFNRQVHHVGIVIEDRHPAWKHVRDASGGTEEAQIGISDAFSSGR